MGAFIDEIGNRHGRLTVVAFGGRYSRGTARWVCRCDCGRQRTVAGPSLRNGETRSCGCLRRETTSRLRRRDGASFDPGYAAYKSARARCENPNSQGYPRYGGRGISFRFASYAQWQAELGPRPSRLHSVDRIDNDGNYEPGNIRWATPKEQVRNQKCPCPDCQKLRGHE